ncbi:MAG: exosortase system-associated protein, TIGR04073 family [Candidatus Sumerlaeia bacterium]|nr:exosortase system-associated protein, TIGR04073 family [Candidatus Sumerlaeia bacterium]
MSRTLQSLHLILAALILGVFTLMPAASHAQVDEDVYRENTDISKMFHKLGRGVSNVLLGWVEIPKTIAKEWRRTEPFTGTIMGTIKGLGFAVMRTFAGFYEIISFPFPVPRNYEPIMYPEFVLPSVWGERLPLYSDEFLAAEGNQSAAISQLDGSPTLGNTSTGSNSIRRY